MFFVKIVKVKKYFGLILLEFLFHLIFKFILLKNGEHMKSSDAKAPL